MKISHMTLQSHIWHGFSCFLPIAILTPSLAIAVPVFAQTQTSPPAQTPATTQATTQKIFYVNPTTGSDRPEHGTNAAPYKTITYAINRVQSGQGAGQPTIIQLANGTYSSNTGEQFPIQLLPNLTLRGNEATKGREVVILGGGKLRTVSGFLQTVAIATADRSELRGVTVTNPNPRGYGLWVENTSPTISNNTLLDNQQDGVLIAGKSSAIVSANQFFRNSTSGLAIEGEASPDIRGNLFQQTTFGMSIRQNANPQITENTFTQNQNGILIQGNAKPILRGNAIVNNRNYGLTISDMAKPDLGKDNEDGNNSFQGNGIFDLQNVSRNSVLVAGNQLDIKRAKGDLQLLNVRSPFNPLAPNLVPNVAVSGSKLPVISTKDNRFANIDRQLAEPKNIPSQLINQGDRANNSLGYESVTSLIVRITPKDFNASVPANTEITATLPPVRAYPPSGEPVNQPIIIAPLSNTSLTPQKQPRYRVVVPVSSPNAVAQVRQLVPNSFASRLNGDLVVQIGAYNDRGIAEVQVSRLAQQGLTARIETIKP
jgi:parallel beta-helix repeat protein